MKNEAVPLASLEAMLFIYGEPLAIKKIAAILRIEENAIEQQIAALKRRYADAEHGISIMHIGGTAQLVTKPECAAVVSTLIRDERDEDLGGAGLETLAIIAYRGPLGRSAIEDIRGVNSSVTLRNLSLRGLIEKQTAKNSGEIYMLTSDCLKQLGVERIEELPEYIAHHEHMPEKIQ
jgi:segregation and condensation protein B